MEFGAQPASVINVDPFPSPDQPDAPKPRDRIIQADSADPNLLQHSELAPGSADEVLALYSVPFYLTSGEQISQMLHNGVDLLAPGGNFRLWPVNFNANGATPEALQERKQYLLHTLKVLSAQGLQISIVFNGNRGDTLIIHKPKTTG